jgi:hypothetical protein
MGLTLRVVVADGVPRGEAENSSGRALDSGAADLGGVLPDNLSEVTVEVDVHILRRVLLAVESPVAHLVVVPLVGNTTSSSLVLETINVASGTPRSEVLAVAAIALLPKNVSVIKSFITCVVDLHVVLENTTVGSVLGIACKLIIPFKGSGRVVKAVDVVVGKHNSVIGTIQREVITAAGRDLNLGFGNLSGLSDNLFNGSLGLLDNGGRRLIDLLLGRLRLGLDSNDRNFGSLLGGGGLAGRLLDLLGLRSLLGG